MRTISNITMTTHSQNTALTSVASLSSHQSNCTNVQEDWEQVYLDVVSKMPFNSATDYTNEILAKIDTGKPLFLPKDIDSSPLPIAVSPSYQTSGANTQRVWEQFHLNMTHNNGFYNVSPQLTHSYASHVDSPHQTIPLPLTRTSKYGLYNMPLNLARRSVSHTRPPHQTENQEKYRLIRDFIKKVPNSIENAQAHEPVPENIMKIISSIKNNQLVLTVRFTKSLKNLIAIHGTFADREQKNYPTLYLLRKTIKEMKIPHSSSKTKT